jgi:hypothetical protein
MRLKDSVAVWSDALCPYVFLVIRITAVGIKTLGKRWTRLGLLIFTNTLAAS